MVDAAEQVKAARAAVLVVPAPELGALVVTGGDQLTWLNGLVTCELAKSRPGDAVYGLAVAKSGKIIADIVVVVDAERLVVVVASSVAETLRASLDHYLIMEDAELTSDAAFAVWRAVGPRASATLDAARAAGAVGGVLDRAGIEGAVILAARDDEAAVASAIASSAQSNGGVVGDADGWRALRIEQGIPELGADFDDATLPQEASLEKVAVSFSKGCYLGQEVVCMLEMRGKVKRRIVSLVIDTNAAPPRGARVTDASGADVGEVTSTAMSPTLGRAVALAMVKRVQGEPGTELRIGDAVAKVVARPVS